MAGQAAVTRARARRAEPETAVPPPQPEIDHPAYYNTGSIEVIDAIEDWQLGFHLGNTVKYVARAGKKPDSTELADLQKARWYLDRYIREVLGGDPAPA